MFINMTDEVPNKNNILSAFIECQESLTRFIKRYVRREGDAEDVLQEAFMRTYAANQKTNIEYPKTYMYKTAKNLAIRENTKMSTRLTEYIEDYGGPMLSSSEPTAFDELSVKEDQQLLKRAIEALPPQCQRVTILRLLLGMPLKKIAAQLEISLSTTEKHISKGLERCDAYMRVHRDGITPKDEDTALSKKCNAGVSAND